MKFYCEEVVKSQTCTVTTVLRESFFCPNPPVSQCLARELRTATCQQSSGCARGRQQGGNVLTVPTKHRHRAASGQGAINKTLGSHALLRIKRTEKMSHSWITPTNWRKCSVWEMYVLCYMVWNDNNPYTPGWEAKVSMLRKINNMWVWLYEFGVLFHIKTDL